MCNVWMAENQSSRMTIQVISNWETYQEEKDKSFCTNQLAASEDQIEVSPSSTSRGKTSTTTKSTTYI